MFARTVIVVGALLIAFASAIVGCSSDSSSSSDGGAGVDSGAPEDGAATDATATDTVAEDVATADATAVDATIADASTPDAFTADASAGDTSPDDAASPDSGVFEAILGERCRYWERVGEVIVNDDPRAFSLRLNDSPDPWLGMPTAQDSACEFHEASGVPCTCGVSQVCSYLGTCVDPPLPVSNVAITITGNGGTQMLVGDGSGTYADITVPDEAIRFRLGFDGFAIETPAMSVPGELIAPAGTLSGSYELPTGISLTWGAPVDGAHVHVHTNINHHVPEPTFTTCVVPAADERMNIDGAMLMPLAVVTGLEFQGIQHVRFAAATTPAGCVEFRFTRTHYISLSN